MTRVFYNYQLIHTYDIRDNFNYYEFKRLVFNIINSDRFIIYCVSDRNYNNNNVISANNYEMNTYVQLDKKKAVIFIGVISKSDDLSISEIIDINEELIYEIDRIYIDTDDNRINLYIFMEAIYSSCYYNHYHYKQKKFNIIYVDEYGYKRHINHDYNNICEIYHNYIRQVIISLRDIDSEKLLKQYNSNKLLQKRSSYSYINKIYRFFGNYYNKIKLVLSGLNGRGLVNRHRIMDSIDKTGQSIDNKKYIIKSKRTGFIVNFCIYYTYKYKVMCSKFSGIDINIIINIGKYIGFFNIINRIKLSTNSLCELFIKNQ